MIKFVRSLLWLFVTTSLFAQCSSGSEATVPRPSGGGSNTNDWLIPSGSVFDGGPGKDGIPALSNPVFLPLPDISYLNDNDLVLGIKFGEEVRLYPHPILDWHEIINDRIESHNIAITYCPLTGTGIGWERNLNGHETTFGVSGLLYNTNLIPYDRATDSNWSQMLLKCVNGALIGTKIETYQVIETTWASWKVMYPDAKVVSDNTGFTRSYGNYPYRDYRTNHDFLIFPVAVEDDRLPAKERVLGVIINEQAKAYRLATLSTRAIEVIQDNFQSTELVVVGSAQHNFMVAFDRQLPDGNLLEFFPVDNALPVVMEDQHGTRWDIFGQAVSGPGQGKQLTQTDSFIGYWVAWGAFYPGLDIHQP